MLNCRPFLRWAGSKRKLLPKLQPYWGDGYNRYIEPFMGSAVLFFAIKPPKAILSDLNYDLVETFNAIKNHHRAVFNRLSRYPLGKETYYKIRQEDVTKLSALDKAARFIYLNRFCFNGLYRTNESGRFNVPYAPTKTGQLPTLEELYTTSKALSNAEILVGDFEKTLQNVQAGDFVYMDPPYAVQNRRIFRQYGPACFGLDDLNRLAALLNEIDQSGATFLVSYAMCKEALDAFNGWHICRTKTQRSIAGFSKHRRKAIELLISNKHIVSIK